MSRGLFSVESVESLTPEVLCALVEQGAEEKGEKAQTLGDYALHLIRTKWHSDEQLLGYLRSRLTEFMGRDASVRTVEGLQTHLLSVKSALAAAAAETVNRQKEEEDARLEVERRSGKRKKAEDDAASTNTHTNEEKEKEESEQPPAKRVKHATKTAAAAGLEGAAVDGAINTRVFVSGLQRDPAPSEVELRAIFAAYGTITHVAVTAPCAVVYFEEHQDACAAIDDPQCVLVEAAIDKKWAMFPQPTPETPTESKSGDDDESNEAASLRKKRVAMEEKLARLAQATIDRELSLLTQYSKELAVLKTGTEGAAARKDLGGKISKLRASVEGHLFDVM